jgi:membrane fusion protein (multidrug efflux system)
MPSKGNIFVIVLSIVGLCLLAGVAYYFNRLSAAPKPAEGGAATAGVPGKAGGPGAQAGPPGGFAVGVEAVAVTVVALQNDVTAVGTLKSNESVVMRPEIAGRIAAINFKDGAAVGKGAVLVALDASTQLADLEQVRANLALAQANSKRNEDLFQKRFISERARDESAATLKVQEAAVALAEARYQKTQIRAPFAGIVGIRNVSVGDYVKEGQDLINLEDIATLKLDFKLPEVFLAQIWRGQDVQVTTDVLPGNTFKATVDAIDPHVEAAGRALSLRARLANPEGKLRPGMFARVRLILTEKREALVVPEEVLVPQGADQFVFRIVDGKAQQTKVTIGARRAAQVEIVDGLKAGDMVVTAGQLKLREGVPVKLAQPSGATPAQAATVAPTQQR